MQKNNKRRSKKSSEFSQNDFYFEDLKRIRKENKRKRNRMIEE